MGMAVFSISAAEIMQVQIHVLPDKNPANKFPLTTRLAWRNDGSQQLPDEQLFRNGYASFPLKGNKHFIKYERDNSALLYAWVFISIEGGVPVPESTEYYGEINVTIDYN